MPTVKHNMRIPDEVWEPAVARAKSLADLGCLGEHGPYSVTDLVRDNLRQSSTEETVEMTILRLKLVRAPDPWAASAEAAS